MDKSCRIILSTTCNLDCHYCCNKLPEIQEKFKMSTLSQLLKINYNVFNLTGGEIALCKDKLNDTINKIYESNKENKIYLYTNGSLHSYDLDYPDRISGINFGYHGKKFVLHSARGFSWYNLPNRIMIEDTEWEKMSDVLQHDFKNIHNLTVKLWQRNNCQKNEDWYII